VPTAARLSLPLPALRYVDSEMGWNNTVGGLGKKIRTTTDMTQPLDNKTISRLENAIKNSQYVQNGQTLKVVPKVNPEIRGGLIVEIADRTIDKSVAAKMAKMNKLLKDTL
jgi:F-type H+-transporting ATPase subunit O